MPAGIRGRRHDTSTPPISCISPRAPPRCRLPRACAGAQAYPTRPITLIVPFPPGGSTDVAARIVADHMSRTLGQQIVVQNISGAGGTTGSTRAMRADPDGYTILMGQMGTHAASVALYPNLAYKPAEDFETIGMVTGFPLIIAAKKDFPANDLKEFIAYVKANSAKLNQAHAGVGSIFFTTCLMLNSIMGTKPTLVPFNGGAPAMNALVGGQVDYMCADIVTGGPQHEAGKIKIYAIAAPARNPALPERADDGGRPGCPSSRCPPGTACSRPRARRSRSSTGSPTRSTRRSTTRRRASACWCSAATSPTRRAAARRRSSRWSRARSSAGRRSSRRPNVKMD